MAGRVDSSMVTTAMELPGHRIVCNFGVVRGIIVRSRSVIGNLGAALQTIVGGNITILTNLCEKTREEAYELLLMHAVGRLALHPWIENVQVSWVKLGVQASQAILQAGANDFLQAGFVALTSRSNELEERLGG